MQYGIPLLLCSRTTITHIYQSQKRERSHMEKYDNRIKEIALLTIQGFTQTKIAQKLGITKQRVGQLVDKAVRAGFPVVRRQIRKNTCATCGVQYAGKNKFCSKNCRSMAPRDFGGPSSQIEMKIMVCDGCGTKFSRTRRLIYIGKKVGEKTGKILKRTFCTQECYLKNGNCKKDDISAKMIH